ncbi:MAG: ABC transporter permease, partial [Oscillospiraceae bacterium]
MRKFGFYARLAAQNMKKNGKYYLPYLLTCVGAAAMLYTMFFLSGNSGVKEMRGAQYVYSMLFLGTGVIGIFSAIIILYTNSFLMKRRKKEIGLYNILGMEKRHIARFLFWETIYTAIVGIVGGLAVGILLSKLMLLVLCKLLRAGVPFGFFVSVPGIVWTAAVFCFIFILCLVGNLLRIGRAKPIELLRGDNEGDREPKTRLLLAIIGVVTLAAGYGIAISVKTPLSALGLFFVAVLLVIAGTYCLFTAGSIAILKALRKNKGYYYTTKHFIAVSGMLHRMKRNAAGLASVCILSTMVLVTVSSTACLYFGTEETIERMYPHDVGVLMFESDEASMNAVVDIVQTMAEESGAEIKNLQYVRYYGSMGGIDDNKIGDILKQASHGEVLNGEGKDYLPTVYVGFDLRGEAPESFRDYSVFDKMEGLTYKSAYIQERGDNADELYSMYGGFFFIGMLLGFMFLMATALIIYYKQVSEGYEDAEGFKIMQQVGMSKQEVRTSIHGQIMTVFFLPIVAATVHVAFAFPMITKLLAALLLTNVGLFAMSTAATALSFACIYAIVYALTAKAYYKIV